MISYSRAQLSDAALGRQLTSSFARERASTAELLADIAEFDARKLYLPAGYPSMFAYCTQKFGLSEDSTYKRIRAARTARAFPAIFTAIAEGRLNLNAVVLLAAHMNEVNSQALMDAAEGKTRFQIEQMLAERFPKQDVAQAISPVRSRGLEQSAPVSLEFSGSQTDSAGEPGTNTTPTNNLPAARPVAAPVAKSQLIPLSTGRFKFQITIGQAALKDLRRAQALLSHQIPNGDLERIFERALRTLVERLEKQKFATTSRPRPAPRSDKPRTIPAHVRRAVRERDGDQCTFVSEDGHRCAERSFLEFDHALEVARGGRATIDGVRLRCRAHNRYTAEQTFGKEFMNRMSTGISKGDRGDERAAG